MTTTNAPKTPALGTCQRALSLIWTKIFRFTMKTYKARPPVRIVESVPEDPSRRPHDSWDWSDAMGFEDFCYSRDIQERLVDYVLGFTLFGFLVHRYRNSPTRFYSRGLPILVAGCMMLHTFPMIRKYSDKPHALKPPVT